MSYTTLWLEFQSFRITLLIMQTTWIFILMTSMIRGKANTFQSTLTNAVMVVTCTNVMNPVRTSPLSRRL